MHLLALHLFPLGDSALIYCAFFLMTSTAVVLAQNLDRLRSPFGENIAVLSVHALAIAAVIAWDHDWAAALMYGLVGTVLVAVLRRRLRSFNLSGQLILAAVTMLTFYSGWWGIQWIHALPVSEAIHILLYIALGISLALLPLSFGEIWLQAAIFGRREWRRPRAPLSGGESQNRPKVSIHVPCYAEPPEVVIETLNALSRLDYPDYEVIVIDNNTQDPMLWKPLERHCAYLGERFRFFHVEGITGAKAGALNYIAPHVAADAELIACVDSDYVAEPDFLQRLTGFFDDPEMGFIQSSHDYRLWEDRPYQRACYWEYLPFYKQMLPALSEWTSSFTVGTMCVVRRRALQEAGGWAEWCLTEDSELAIRIHALGYKSVALPDTFGRGLVPETFIDYKKQRFRWTAGPMQQLKRHFRLLLPGFSAGRSRMTAQQRYFELVHCTSGIPFIFAMLGSLVAPLITLQLVSLANAVPIPKVLLPVLLATMMMQITFGWLKYRMLGASLKDMIWGGIASASLQHTKEVAAAAGLFARKPLRWTRTNKFKALPGGLSALTSTRWETARGVTTIAMAVFCASHLHMGEPGLASIGVLFLFISGLGYLAAPLMAVLGERDLVRQEQMSSSLPIKKNEILETSE
jgi:cellulose synthase/poly-beta-1,6-N-acetylglucosamine synthase-like glycosyltransferase